MRAPRDSLNSSLVLTELECRLSIEFVPDHQLVIIASGGELLIFVVPLQTTNLLLVSDKFSKPLVWLPYIAMVYNAVS